MPPDPRHQQMLGLAALTYRYYAGWTAGRLHDAALQRVIRVGLSEPEPSRLRKYIGDWDLVWGPESYRAPLSLFDDSMMFVARDQHEPRRYAVAVRGTNPISSFDWVLGDLWVSRPVPWKKDEENPNGPMLSMSTALGLTMLQHMRAEAPDGQQPLWRFVDQVAANAGRVVNDGFAAVQARWSPLLQRTERALGPVLEGIRPHAITEAQDDQALIACVDHVDGAVQNVVQAVDAILKPLGNAAHESFFDLLDAAIRIRARNAKGHDVMTFLQGAIAEAGSGPIQIEVTGHSKGGALAPAVALWLTEELGAKAEVHCVAFAGPSPGNEAFADRFQAKLDGRFDHVVNELDIIPHAWQPDTLPKVAKLYEPAPKCPPPLAALIGEIANDTRELGYKHLGGRTTVLKPGLSPDRKTFAGQMIHQHLDGYFAGLNMKLATSDFFDPIP